MSELSTDVGTLRLHPGDRVRHVCDPAEGVVEAVADLDRIPTVAVRLETGGVEVSCMGFWERVEGYGGLGRRTAP